MTLILSTNSRDNPREMNVLLADYVLLLIRRLFNRNVEVNGRLLAFEIFTVFKKLHGKLQLFRFVLAVEQNRDMISLILGLF